MNPSSRPRLTYQEVLDVLGLSGIFGLRLLGLFLVLPVLSLYARGLEHSTPFLAGLAVGAYGLTQTLLQVPVGMLSDRLGRKKIIAAGLAVYALGSILAASSSTITGLILGRLIQGAGAIASVVTAMVADLTREEVRTQAMVFVGITVGISFTLGFILGPLLAARWGVPHLFWLIAAFDLLGILYLWLFIPEPETARRSDISLSHLKIVLKNKNLRSLNICMFLLHVGLTSVFVVTPFFLIEHFAKSEFWKVYVPMILLGGGIMIPCMVYAETRKRLKEMILAGIAVAALGYFLLGLPARGSLPVVSGLIIYFIGFNLLEPVLPALVTRFAPQSLRGTAMGAFNMSQFFGAFCGGALGGLFLKYSPHGLFYFLIFLGLAWTWAALKLDNPKHIRQIQLKLPGKPLLEPQELLDRPGIYDAIWKDKEGAIEVKFFQEKISEEQIRALLKC